MKIVVYEYKWTDEDGTPGSKWTATYVGVDISVQGPTAHVALRRLITWLTRALDANDEQVPWLDTVRIAAPLDPEEEPCWETCAREGLPPCGFVGSLAEVKALRDKVMTTLTEEDPKLAARLVWSEPVPAFNQTPPEIVALFDAGVPFVTDEVIPEGWEVRLGGG